MRGSSRLVSRSDVNLSNVLRPAGWAAVLFTGFLTLGYAVARHGEPGALWSFAQAVRGHAIGLAWALSNAGFFHTMAPLSAACLLLAVFSKRWRVPALFVVAVTLLCWGAADGFQHYFARPRRDDWLIRHEHSFSYPSSHAAISVGFYALWGVLLLRSALPRWLRWSAGSLLLLLALGIMWSRLALAAHYPTDVFGGALLGAVVVLLALALLRTAGVRLLER